MKIEDVFYKLRPVSGRQLDLLWQEYLVADAPLRRTIEKVLRVQLAQRLGETFESEQVLLKPPPRHLASGDYPAGTIHYGRDGYYEFGLREQEFIQHIGIFGRSGSGKTNLAFLILRAFVQAQKPFLVFDWKRNYRDLLTREEFRDALVFTAGRDISPFRFNPLIPPPGTQATVWLKKLIEVMCHAYFLGEGVSILLLRAIDALYRDCGLYTREPAGCPTIAHVRDWLRNYRAKGREASWMESALRAVETLCFGEVGNVLNQGPFFDVSRLLDGQVILELDALTNADKTFLIEALLLWIHHYRLAQEKRESFKHAIIIEEAHHILLRKKQEVTGEETVICLDQHPSLISKPALGNTYATFAMNLKHRGDIAMIQDSLLLDSEQAGYLGRLEVGWAIVRLQGRWFWPFLVRLPLVEVEKGKITDARLAAAAKARQKELCSLLRPGQGFSRMISTKEGISGLNKGRKEAVSLIPLSEKRDNKKGKDQCTISLTTKEEEFLGDVWRYAGSGIKERYLRLGLSVRAGNNIQKSLFSNGLLRSVNVCTGKGRLKALSLTGKGKRVLGIDDAESNRHGGAEHRFWAKTIARHLRAQGWQVQEEAPAGGGRTIDLLATHGSRRVAFEIETGKSDAAANIGTALAAGVDKLFIIATSARAKKSIESKLAGYPGVEILSAREALERSVPAGDSSVSSRPRSC